MKSKFQRDDLDYPQIMYPRRQVMERHMRYDELSQRTRNEINDSFFSDNGEDLIAELRDTQADKQKLETFVNWLWCRWGEHEQRSVSRWTEPVERQS